MFCCVRCANTGQLTILKWDHVLCSDESKCNMSVIMDSFGRNFKFRKKTKSLGQTYFSPSWKALCFSARQWNVKDCNYYNSCATSVLPKENTWSLIKKIYFKGYNPPFSNQNMNTFQIRKLYLEAEVSLKSRRCYTKVIKFGFPVSEKLLQNFN